MSRRLTSSVFLCLLGVSAGCAVKITPDPRMPGEVSGRPVTLTVCFVDGDGPHLEPGDQVEFSNSRLGRLRIRHLPGPENQQGAWNGGGSVRVKTAMLTERLDPNDNKTDTRRFVPVGRFTVEVQQLPGHARFDFLQSKATENLEGSRYERCNVPLGSDEVLIRGVEDDERHGGLAHLR